MSSKFNKGDKPKGRFAQTNINLVYKGNASEIQSKPTLRSGGFQLVGKLQGTRRNPPPPPWVPSIKAEMGGQSTRVNIVPPGGSGWGTGSTTTGSSDNATSNRESEPTVSADSSILKDITKTIEKSSNGVESTVGGSDTAQPSIVKPPQKPFFAPRSSKSGTPKPVGDSSDSTRSLAAKNAGPTVPFYQRPAATATSSQLTKNSSEENSPEKEEQIQSPNPSTTTATPHTGWAAVATEEPDFQERINFSDEEEDDIKPKAIPEQPKEAQPPISENTWTPAPIQPPRQTPVSTFSRAAWEQPTPCFNSATPLSHPFSAPFCATNEGMYPNAPTIPMGHASVLTGREASALQEHLQRPPFANSEAQAQAQREERTLAYKTAVSRAQMARKKLSADIDPMDVKRRDQPALEPTKGNPTDSNIFSQSLMQSGVSIGAPGSFPVHTPATHPSQHPQQTMDPILASMNVLYNNGYSNMMHSVAPGSNHLSATQIKAAPPPSIPNPIIPPAWNPSPFSSTNQTPFNQQSLYLMSNPPKLPANQDLYFKSDPFAMEPFNQQTAKSINHGQGMQGLPGGDSLERIDRQVDDSGHPYTIGEPSAIDTANFQIAKPQAASRQPTESQVVDIPKDAMIQNRARTVIINGPRLQISAHVDGTRTAFTPPAPSVTSTTESSSTHLGQPQQQPHITPLMEVDLSGKWSEKEFDTFPPPSGPRGGYSKSMKPGRGGSSRHTNSEDKSGGYRFNSYVNSRQNRPAPKDAGKRPPHRRFDESSAEDFVAEVETDRLTEGSTLGDGCEDQAVSSRGGRRDQRRGGGTFPRSQRGRGSGRFTRSNRAAPAEFEDYHNNGDYYDHDRNQRDRRKGGGNGQGSGGYKGNRRGDDHSSLNVGAGGSRGRGNFSRSGPSTRRYGVTDDDPRSTESQNRKPRGQPGSHRVEEAFDNTETATKAPSVVGSEDAVVNSDGEQFPQRTRGGDGVSQRGGRPRRGAHSGASGQSQRLPQRRDRTDRANNTNNRRHNANSHRRHPDEDDDDGNDFDGGNMANANNNTSSSGGNAGKSQQHNGSNNKGGSETTSTNGGSGGAPAGHQQKGSGDATDGCTTSNPSAPLSVKPRRHAHSVTLTSDLEVWETASEGLSSSLLGTSPGASLAEAKNDEKHFHELTDDSDMGWRGDEGAYGGYPSKRGGFRRPPPAGEIIPLMSINAEAPPSYCDNPSFLDSPPPMPGGDCKAMNGTSESAAEFEDAVSVVSSASPSEEDGFMEVRSKSSKKQQRAKKQQMQKSSISSNEEKAFGGTKSSNRENAGKSRGQSSSSPKSDQKSFPKTPGKDNGKRAPLNSTATTTAASATASKLIPAKKPTQPPPTNAWLKPLQETINEKAAAAAAAAAAAQSAKLRTRQPAVAAPVSTPASTSASSSYAWSFVVGSRTTTTNASVADSKKEKPSALPSRNEVLSTTESASSDRHPKTIVVNKLSAQSSQNVAVSEPDKTSHCTSFTGQSLPPKRDQKHDVIPATSAVVSTITSCSTTTATSTTSANVCKVRPQKQPTSNSAATSPPPQTAASTQPSGTVGSASGMVLTKPEITVPAPFGGLENSATMMAPQPIRRPFGAESWLNKSIGGYPTVTSLANSASAFFESYGTPSTGGKELEATGDPNAAALGLNVAAAAALYMQQHQQQQPQQFRQNFQHQQTMLGFGLPDLRPQNTRAGGACNQTSMGADNYFATPPPFATAPSNAGQPPRGLYHPQQRGYSSWQQQAQHQVQAQHQQAQQQQSQHEAVMAAVAGQALWPSPAYTPPPPALPYVGVIGGDRPSSSANAAAAAAAAAMAASRLQHQQQSQPHGGGSAGGTAGSSLYAPGAPALRGPGGPFGQGPAPPPPGGLYASSPTHPTPPPPHPFDPNFAYANGGLPNSSSVFSHQSGPAGGHPPVLGVPVPHRHQAGGALPPRSLGDPHHPHHPNQQHHPAAAAPVFINPQTAPYPGAPALPVPGLTGPNVSMATSGLHF